ncbi:MAG: LysM peptidoglycan-binding domain-containing protein [Anaerolineae bacterium]
MRLNRVICVVILLVLAVAATACTKVKPSSESSLSLSGAGPTLTAKVTDPGDLGAVTTPQSGDESTFASPLSLAISGPDESSAVVEGAAVPTAAVVAPTATPEPSYRMHSVAWGDTLLDIAMLYGVGMDELMQLNGLADNTIYIGQVLKIPEQNIPAGAQQYTVQSGDSLYSIATAFGISLDDLMRVNNLTNGYYLQVGQTLAIPTAGAAAVAQAPSSTGVQAASTGPQVYTVQPGDTLFTIAELYGVSGYDIALANGLGNPNVLEVGQRLTIP